MKNNKCPYCSKRFSYISAYASRRKSQYICERCGKESKIVINSKVILIFVVCALVSVAIMVGWITAGLANNPLGILLVAVPLIVFTAISPNFVNFVPLKKYKKSMEAKRAGIEYSDNLITSELEESEPNLSGFSGESGTGFQINADVFNKIKAERVAARERLMDGELISDSSEIKKPVEEKTGETLIKKSSDSTRNSSRQDDVIKPSLPDNFQAVSYKVKNESYQNYSSDAPLKKIHSESIHYSNRTRHYIPNQNSKEPKKSDTNRYSANRKF